MTAKMRFMTPNDTVIMMKKRKGAVHGASVDDDSDNDSDDDSGVEWIQVNV